MIFVVNNENICVDCLYVSSVSSTSILQIGDSHTIQLSSAFDTPPESVITGPLVPLAPKG